MVKNSNWFQTEDYFDLWKVNFEIIVKAYQQKSVSIGVTKELHVLEHSGDALQFQAAQLFSCINPVKVGNLYDITATLNNISPVYFRDHEYSVEDIRNILAFFRIVPPSDYTTKKITQIKKVYNGGVPIFLYGHKLHNGIGYEEWSRDCSEKALQSALGYRLGELASITAEQYKEYQQKFNIGEFRRKMYTDTKGELQKYTYWKYNNVGNYEFDALPKTARLMLCQCWIFNSECRSDKMILDWGNWGNIPPPLDRQTIRYDTVNYEDFDNSPT